MRIWLPALAGWAALIFWLSSIPNPPGATGEEWRNIVGHFVLYFVLGFLAAKVIAAWKPSLAPPAVTLAAWTCAVLYGVSDEHHQSFVPGRHASMFDVVVNAIGAAVGVLFWMWLNARTGGPEGTAGLDEPAGRRTTG